MNRARCLWRVEPSVVVSLKIADPLPMLNSLCFWVLVFLESKFNPPGARHLAGCYILPAVKATSKALTA